MKKNVHQLCLIIAGFITYFCYVVTKVRCGVCFLTAILHRGLRNDSLNVALHFLYYFWTCIQFSLDLSFWIFISHFNLFSIRFQFHSNVIIILFKNWMTTEFLWNSSRIWSEFFRIPMANLINQSDMNWHNCWLCK